jgi:F0F1-type ATP synthase membrane subunit c/vacuolar-type H+-ATPase subunit K
VEDDVTMHEIEEINQRVRPLRTIWLSMIAGVVAFTVVVLYLIGSQAVTPIPVLRAGAGSTLAIILVLGLIGANYVRKIVEKTPPSATRSQVARKWQAGWLVGQGIKEAIGLLGLVLALLVGASSWAMAFGIASAASMVMTPPWEAELRQRLQHAEDDD